MCVYCEYTMFRMPVDDVDRALRAATAAGLRHCPGAMRAMAMAHAGGLGAIRLLQPDKSERTPENARWTFPPGEEARAALAPVERALEARGAVGGPVWHAVRNTVAGDMPETMCGRIMTGSAHTYASPETLLCSNQKMCRECVRKLHGRPKAAKFGRWVVEIKEDSNA
jgi:hypothetical protein